MANRRRGAKRRVQRPSVPGAEALGRGAARLGRLLRRRGNRRKAPTATQRRQQKIQSSEAAPRTQAAAALASWIAPLLVAVAAFATPLLGVRAYQYVMRTGHFHVHDVLIEGNKRLSLEDIRQVAGIEPGTHVLTADLDEMAIRLMNHPWISWARLQRELPDRLLVEVVEHTPVAYVALADLFLVNERGRIYAKSSFDDRLDLPIITGVSPEALADPNTRRQTEAELLRAVNLSRLYQSMGLAGRWPVGEIRLDATRGTTLVLSEIGTEAVLGREPFKDKLWRLEWVLENLRQQGKVAEYIVLDSYNTKRPGADDGRVVVKADLAPTRAGLMADAAERARQAQRQVLGLPEDPNLFGPQAPPTIGNDPRDANVGAGVNRDREKLRPLLTGGRPAAGVQGLDGEEN